MSEAEHLADALDGLFVNPDHGWFTPFVVAVEGLTAAQAATVPAPGFNSVWAVVNHVRFWQEYFLLRLQGQSPDRQALGAQNGWPPPQGSGGEQDWQAARARALELNRELVRFVAGLSDDEVGAHIAEGRPRRDQVIHGVLAHNSYHTCEIISIRHMLGIWLERT